jgi:hypothetical protein
MSYGAITTSYVHTSRDELLINNITSENYTLRSEACNRQPHYQSFPNGGGEIGQGLHFSPCDWRLDSMNGFSDLETGAK